MMTKRKFPDPDGPAKLREGHVRDRLISPIAGAPRAWRNSMEHPLLHAHTKGWIDGSEFAAGDLYRTLFELRGRSGVDTLEIVGGGKSTTPWTQAQANAIRVIRDIEIQLERLDTDRSNWVIICRKFCGEGYSMRKAVEAAGYRNPRFTRHRIKLALNKLSLAIQKTHIDMRPSE